MFATLAYLANLDFNTFSFWNLPTPWLQVRKRPLNKKELAKNEEDIITIETHSNSLTVHETKLKVSVEESFDQSSLKYQTETNPAAVSGFSK